MSLLILQICSLADDTNFLKTKGFLDGFASIIEFKDWFVTYSRYCLGLET